MGKAKRWSPAQGPFMVEDENGRWVRFRDLYTKEQILENAWQLVNIYYDIAAEAIGEEELWRRRDERLLKIELGEEEI